MLCNHSISKCFLCQETGHYAKDCVKKKSEGSTNKGLWKVNGLSAKPLQCSLCKSAHIVEVGKNKGKFKTCFAACDKFREMSVNERAQTLADAKGCVKCTDWTHVKKDCDAVYGKRQWQPCTLVDSNNVKCGKNHHSLLHGASHAYVCVMKVNTSGGGPGPQLTPTVNSCRGGPSPQLTPSVNTSGGGPSPQLTPLVNTSEG